MQTVLIVIHLLIVLALVGVVLIQRSEGGGLGIGGGSGFMTARGAANALTRTTALLGAGFFATSLILGIMAMNGERPTDILNRIPAASGSQTAPAGGNGILDQLGGGTTTPETAPAQPAAPASSVPSSQ
ncbi:preprotein translocase subunit SecG [Pseudochrobactrum sp. sp1633]|uniref:preprotein translocase subunit SecG n=1 Tax=Pseudochrobactrum sp. sp1633 TaxID=3036706 RepID=UPI0025A53607|nr:preprotein translocase subunit SecG [Pseudochrobactrum sp. sp1633]MDM8344706.1 preprotein translocase subunit SecG [Pseudochrobactrum sp. sp1633]HWD13534.1 preprotein translocase subunit SecG [Pseudochrobactrum sp.]